MANEMRIYAAGDFDRWLNAFNELGGPGVPAAAVEEWNVACEILFGATQQYAHVLSGDMLSSGKLEVDVEGKDVVGTITYGGGQRSNTKPHWKHQEIDYVPYELARGGSHDFIDRAVVKTVPRLEEAVGKMIEAALKEAL